VNNTKSRYLIVGGINFVSSFFVFALLLKLLENSISYISILILSFIVNAPISHWNQRKFVWQSTNSYFPELKKFIAVNIPPFAFNLLLLPIFIETWNLAILPTQLFTSALIIIGTYLVHKSWTFK
jgi:putative flippase GtrA